MGDGIWNVLGLINKVLCRPMSSIPWGGFVTSLTLSVIWVDMVVYLMRGKFESFKKFKEFRNEVYNQLGKKIETLRLDWGGGYLSQEFVDHLKWDK
jgi:hypothetical protein